MLADDFIFVFFLQFHYSFGLQRVTQELLSDQVFFFYTYFFIKARVNSEKSVNSFPVAVAQ